MTSLFDLKAKNQKSKSKKQKTKFQNAADDVLVY
jgi:hypothetical protein